MCKFCAMKFGHLIADFFYDTRNSQRLQYLSRYFIPRFEAVSVVKFDVEVGDSHVYVLWTLKYNCRRHLLGWCVQQDYITSGTLMHQSCLDSSQGSSVSRMTSQSSNIHMSVHIRGVEHPIFSRSIHWQLFYYLQGFTSWK